MCRYPNKAEKLIPKLVEINEKFNRWHNQDITVVPQAPQPEPSSPAEDSEGDYDLDDDLSDEIGAGNSRKRARPDSAVEISD